MLEIGQTEQIRFHNFPNPGSNRHEHRPLSIFFVFSFIFSETLLQFDCAGKAPVSRAVYLSMSIALGKKIAANVFYAARIRDGA